jgi:RHS repeat-associated protein
MQALARTSEEDCYTRAANDDYIYGGPGNRTKFYYDNDYRLTESKLNGTENLGVTYDVSGNITSRTDVASGASWTYDPSRYHAVTEAGSSSYTFTYDANGNAVTRFGSAINWSSYNYPTSVTAVDVTGTENVQFSYGPDRSRWMQNYDSGTETTFYIGGLMEQVENSSGTDYRHYVYAGSEPVAILSRKSTLVNTWSYLLSDHIGSIAAVTNSSGAIDVNESFSSFGARRNPATWSGAPTSTDLNSIAGLSRQGYTFQTALGQSMGLNHMNGRVQDAITGRFLSADPNIPHRDWAQSYNRYSYVVDNPLTFTDPTGFLIPTGGSGGCPTCDGPGYLGPDSDEQADLTTMFEQQAINAWVNNFTAALGAALSTVTVNGTLEPDPSLFAMGAADAASSGGGADQDVTPSPYSGGQTVPTAFSRTPESLNPPTQDDDGLEEVIVMGSHELTQQEFENAVTVAGDLAATYKGIPGPSTVLAPLTAVQAVGLLAKFYKIIANEDYKYYEEADEHLPGYNYFNNVTWNGATFDQAWQNLITYGLSGRPQGPH